MKLNYLIIFIFILYSNVNFSQDSIDVLKLFDYDSKAWVRKKFNIDSFQTYVEYTFQKDTFFLTFRRDDNKIYVKLKNDVVIVEGHFGSRQSCTYYAKDGIFIYRYPNGILKKIEEYKCNNKTGKWISFYENGVISKIENYTSFSRNIDSICYNCSILEFENVMLHHDYIEFYDNGTVKVEGKYKITFDAKDSIKFIQYDFETYSENIVTTYGKYHLPKSSKTGFWNYYNSDGKLVKIEDHGNQ